MADSPLNTGATQKTAQDWVRQLRFSSAVNKSTLGVDTDRVTPQLMLASSKKLLGISKGEQQGDMKDSLQYQKIYGPVEYFAQRIQKDGGNVARTMLWKATNKGNLDFIGSGSLQPHISAVFNQSGLSQFIDNTTPLQGIDTSMKVTRVGEGGIPTQEVAPIQMRLVQPSYYGYVDGVRTAEKCYLPDTEIFTIDGWKKITDLTLNDKLAILIDGRPAWSNPLQLQRYDHDGLIYAFQNRFIDFAVTPGHRMYTAKRASDEFTVRPIDQIYGTDVAVLCGCDKPSVVDEKQKWFYLPPVEGTKNIQKVDIVNFATFIGQYLGHDDVQPEDYSQRLNVSRKQLCLYCKQFGNRFQKFIPEWIFTAPTRARRAFVDAMLKGDGSEQRHLNTASKRLAKDFARLLFELGQSVNIVKRKQRYVSTVTGKKAQDIYQVVWLRQLKHHLPSCNNKKRSGKGYHTFQYTGKVYCPTVPGGLVYVRRDEASKGFWCGNSPGITGYLTKNVLKGTDGKLYQKFLNARTGQEQYVDSQKAASSVVTTNEYIDSKDKFIYALGGPRGVRIVQRSKVDYILPRSDEAYSTAANYVPMLSGIKAMRLLMGCHHPQTPILIVDKNGLTDIIPAKRVGHLEQAYMFGCDDKGQDALYDLQTVVPRIPQKNSKFKKVTLQSGRILPTSAQHKWYIYTEKGFKQIPAKDLKQGMLVPRSLFASLPVRTTTIMGKPMSKQICTMLGRLIRTLKTSAYNYKFTIVVDKQAGIDQRKDIQDAFEQLGVLKYNIFKTHEVYSVSLKDPVFIDWIDQNIGSSPQTLHIPSCLLSLPKGFTSQFLDSYYKDLTNVGEDDQGSSWLLDFPNAFIRDGISLMLNKIFTDTQYRDTKINTKLARALKLVPMKTTMGDVVLQKISSIEDVKAPAIMIDIDCGDNVYAAGNGIITHNSKYGAQAVPLQQREAPWVRSLDEATGMDMPTKIGKMMGTQWAPKSGMIKAVRDDRIDILYDDGTTGSVGLYKNFPANAKGWITNYPKVKAGDKVTKGQLLASSNYTDDNGVMATGRNLRVGYMSFKGGTYEDGCAISQSAAKKMGYTTMYKTAMDKDKSIRTAKSLYNTWKPGKYTKEQLQNLDDDGIVKVGSIINKGDPMILGIRTTEPSPGTLGKRLLTDVTQVWQHAHPGTVTDIVNTKNGIRVYATVSSPLKEGDKISAPYGNKATCYDSTTYVFTDSGWKLFKDLTDSDKVATLGADGTAHFQTPSDRQIFDYEGQMLGYRNRFVAFCVTPDHKMWCKPDFEYYRHPQRPFKRVEAQQMYNRDFVHVVAADFPDGNQPQFFQVQAQKHINNPSYVVQNKWKTQDMAAFLGIYLSQGNLNNQYHIKISQKRDLTDPLSGLRCDRIEALLTRMGFHYTYNQKCYVISNKSLYKYLQRFGKSIDKYVPQEVFGWSHRLQQIFLDWFYMGDGQKVFGSDSAVSGRIRVISKRLIEDLQRLYILNGYHATVKEYKDRVRTYKGVSKVYSRLYGVSFYKQAFRTTFSPASSKQGKKYQGYYKVPYKGKVYCCTVSTGVILVQKDGCPMWCGNCSQVIPDEQMPRDEKGRPLQLLFDPLGIISRCYDAQTEFLTKEGWKLGKDVLPQDMLYCYNPQTNTCQFMPQQQEMYINHYKGTMYGVSNRATNFLVTKGHTVWAKSQYKDAQWKQYKIQDIYGKRYYLPILGSPAGQVEQVSDFVLPQVEIHRKDTHTTNQFIAYDAHDWAALLGWYLAQGNTTTGAQYKVHIAQDQNKNPEKYKEIQGLLNRLGLRYHYGHTNHQFHIRGKRLATYFAQFGKCHQKFIPQWLFTQPSSVKQAFIDALFAGDGYRTKTKEGSNIFRIVLTSQRLIDQLQNLFAELGIVTVKQPVQPDKRYKNAKPMFSLGVSTIHKDKCIPRYGWYTKEYDGTVYCPTVPTGYVLTRRHGRLICLGNTNPSQLMEVGLGKVAQKIGKPIVMPQFMPKGQSRLKYVKDLMKKHNVPWKQTVYDPGTNRSIKNVYTGNMYFMPLKHISDTKMSARGTGAYTAQGIPASGGPQGSKRIGALETSALVGHNAFDFLVNDAKLIRGQSNAQFWRSIRTGQIPVMPGEPLVHKKFFAHLQGSGMNVQKHQKGVSIFALSNKDVQEMAGNRELKSNDTYEQKSFRAIDGGLFGKDVFGQEGKNWGFIKLDQPLPNPVMQEPLARLLNMTDQDFQAVVQGRKEVNGLKSAKDIQQRLSKYDMKKQKLQALQQLKQASPSRRDAALKRYVAIARMQEQGVQPSQYMLDRIPVLPPEFRPITSHGGLTMVADSNYLYSQLLNARNDAREAQNLPDEYKQEAQANIYRKWKELVGLYDPSDVKLKSKNVKGLLKWALGKSPKLSAFNVKVLGSTVDTVGRGVVVPSTKIALDEIGMPIQMAWDVYSPFIVRKLVQQNYTPVQAMQLVKDKAQIAKDALVEAVAQRPVVMNRAPSLHKLSLMGFNVKLTNGHAIKVNPSIVVPFGMDFDGDTVNLHVPVSKGAIQNVRQNMMPSKNLISMRKNKILYKPQKAYTQGIYVASRMAQSKDVKAFNSLSQAKQAFHKGIIDVDTPIVIKK